MKKLLLVLLVIALASFLLVGCFGVPDGTEGEGEGEGEVGICPTVAVSETLAIGTKNYLKAGKHTITVTFAVPTEPVSVYIGEDIKANPVGVPDDAKEVVMYTTDKKVYTGVYTFKGVCAEDYIYVVTCATCAPCKTAFVVDGAGPKSEITITSKACVVCPEVGFCDLIFKTPTQCDVCCGDGCSGFASYTIDLYTVLPFDVCCDISCATVYKTVTGTTCPVDKTIRVASPTTASSTSKKYYAVTTLLDILGNRTRYYATLTLDSSDCVLVAQEYEGKVAGLVSACSDFGTPKGAPGAAITIGACLP